ncbi:hypothetical protein ACYX7E_09915 [Luteimonas sp. RIT-PG2_3]
MADRKMTFCFSRDGCRNWSNLREQSLGELGQYRKEIRFYLRAGNVTMFSGKIRNASPVKAPILGAVMQVTPSEF